MPLTPLQVSPAVHTTGTGTVTCTLPNPTTAGSSLVACITGNGTTANPVATAITLGGAADHWAQAVANNPAVQSDAQIWYDPNCAAGQTSVVITFGTAGGGTIDKFAIVYEVPGLLTADKTISANGSASTTWTSGATPTTAQAAEIFFGAQINATTAVSTATGAGTWTTAASPSGPSRWQLSGYQIVAATGTATFSGTQLSSTYSVAVATFFETVVARIPQQLRGRRSVPRPYPRPSPAFR